MKLIKIPQTMALKKETRAPKPTELTTYKTPFVHSRWPPDSFGVRLNFVDSLSGVSVGPVWACISAYWLIYMHYLVAGTMIVQKETQTYHYFISKKHKHVLFLDPLFFPRAVNIIYTPFCQKVVTSSLLTWRRSDCISPADFVDSRIDSEELHGSS